jgi:hypothetical protein
MLRRRSIQATKPGLLETGKAPIGLGPDLSYRADPPLRGWGSDQGETGSWRAPDIEAAELDLKIAD